MSTMPARDKPGSLLQAIWRWFTRSDRAGRDLMGLSDREVERIAEDLSVSTAELYHLARSDSRSADLLKQRMAALDLDCEEVARLMPETMHDLQRRGPRRTPPAAGGIESIFAARVELGW